MSYLLIGIAVSLNIIFILLKFKLGRTADATLDLVILICVMYVFTGSYGALVIGTIGSLIVSLYLFISPPELSVGTSQ